MTLHYNKHREKPKRQILRNNMTQAEVILWSQLRGNNLGGYKFRRQYSIDRFVLDFYCPELKLVIEIDGESHSPQEAVEHDKIRESHIKQFGIVFLRFTNEDVRKALTASLKKIVQTIHEREKSISPSIKQFVHQDYE
jgi:very-short-patch-repair endonuclease